LIHQKHPYKPNVKSIRILFAGQSLNSEMLMKDVLQGKLDTYGQQENEITLTFHLMIFKDKGLLKQLNIGE